MSADRDDALLALGEAVRKLAAADMRADMFREARDDAFAWCIEAGVSTRALAKIAGVSQQRVAQIAPGPKPETAETPKKKADDGRVSDTHNVDLSTNRLIDMSTNLQIDNWATLSNNVTVRDRRNIFSRRGMTYACPMQSMAEITATATEQFLADSSTRLLVVGDVDPDGLSATEAAKRWALGSVGEGWDVVSAYTPAGELPSVRLKDQVGRELVIMRAAAWFGSNDHPVAEIQKAWHELEHVIGKAFPGAVLADTPATTGRALFARTIGQQTSYPVASDEIRELIATTTGQGRIELVTHDRDTLPRFTQYDGRLMYAAHCWGLGVGEPTLWTPAAIEQQGIGDGRINAHGRGWWHVRATVPDDWSHVGILPLRAGDSWEYPHEPGRVFDTWCDGSELYAATLHGWRVDRLEGISWREGKPLNSWRDKLVSAWQATDNELTRKAIRSLILFTIGAFASRVHPVSHSVSADQPELVSADALPGTVTRVDDRLVWQTPGATSEWSANLRHPEWSAAIWGRVRSRMALAAIAQPFNDVLGFATDALYMADEATGLGATTGQIGELRIKGQIREEVPAPTSWAEMYRLRDRGEIGWAYFTADDGGDS